MEAEISSVLNYFKMFCITNHELQGNGSSEKLLTCDICEMNVQVDQNNHRNVC